MVKVGIIHWKKGHKSRIIGNMNSQENGSMNEQDSNLGQFAHLGAPREYSHDEVVRKIQAGETNTPLRDALQSEKPPLSFRYIKTHALNTTPGMYMLYGGIVVVITVSVMASVTQGILLLKDRLFSRDTVAMNTDIKNGSNANNSASNTDSSMQGGALGPNQNEPRGSDDGRLSSESELNFVPMYKVANEDSIANLGITAKGYYVADLKTGERIMAKNANQAYPIASVSKLMTALIAYEKMDLQQVVVVSKDSYNTYGAQGQLLPGEKIKLGDLLYPLLMESSNDGAEVISESYGRENFMLEMNKKAALLGMHDTYYEDPSGLNPKNVSSSEDLFKLVKYIKEHAPVLYDMTRVREFAILKHKWLNQNRLLNSEYFTGGKNGYIDESRWTTASTFDVVMAKGGKRSIAIILLKSENREGDALKLIKFLQKNVYYTETGNF